MRLSPQLTPEAASQLGNVPDRKMTVPTLGMTLPRALAGLYLPYHMAKGWRGASAISIAAAASDKETWGAVLAENKWPGQGLGFSEFGKAKDPIVDAEFIGGAAVGILLSPRVPVLSKLAGVIAIAKVADQAIWAKGADARHRKATGEPLVINVGWIGKWATAFTLAAEASVGLTHDLNPNKPTQAKLRKGISYVAPVLAGTGAVLGYVAKKKNEKQLQDKLQAHRDKNQ